MKNKNQRIRAIENFLKKGKPKFLTSEAWKKHKEQLESELRYLKDDKKDQNEIPFVFR